MKQKFFKLLLSFVILTFFGGGLLMILGFQSIKNDKVLIDEKRKIELIQEQKLLKAEELILIKNRIKLRLINEVKSCMYEIVPDTKLDPICFTDLCIEYNTDIVFALSQGIIESHLGTKGKASITNSVWNVGTYDDGQILYKYKHPNGSIEPYLDLINRRYLVKKNIHQLLNEEYINDKGKRFASAKNYEKSIKKLMLKINNETLINFYQNILEN